MNHYQRTLSLRSTANNKWAGFVKKVFAYSPSHRLSYLHPCLCRLFRITFSKRLNIIKSRSLFIGYSSFNIIIFFLCQLLKTIDSNEPTLLLFTIVHFFFQKLDESITNCMVVCCPGCKLKDVGSWWFIYYAFSDVKHQQYTNTWQVDCLQ